MKCKLDFLTYFIGMQVFIFVWFFSSLAISEGDIRSHSIPRMMVNVMVKEGTFVLATQDLRAENPRGDLVAWHGNVLPWKQPGIGIIGSAPVYFSKKLGMEYDDLTGFAIASAFSTGISTAILSALVFFLLIREFPLGSSIYCSLVVGMCSTLTVYSGTIHHDPVATMFIFLGYFLFQVFDLGRGILKLFIPGVLFGFSTFVSLLPIGINSILFLYIVFKIDKPMYKLLFVFGVIVGLIPILTYQWYYFDSPLNTAGHIYSITHGTTIFSSWEVVYQRFLAYFSFTGRVNLYIFNPLLVLGVIGLIIEAVWNKSGLRESSLVVLFTIVGHGAYMIFVGGGNTASPFGYGDCQYGPRYWIAPIPFMSLGIAPLFRIHMHNLFKILFFYLLGFLFLWSFIVNQAGLHFGHTYCGASLAGQFFDYFNMFITRKNWDVLMGRLVWSQTLALITSCVLFLCFRIRRHFRNYKTTSSNLLYF